MQTGEKDSNELGDGRTAARFDSVNWSPSGARGAVKDVRPECVGATVASAAATQ